jgi:hypothetical protein
MPTPSLRAAAAALSVAVAGAAGAQAATPASPDVRAQDSRPVRDGDMGPMLGVRLGLGVPLGRTLEDARDGRPVPLSDDLKLAIPIWLDAGWRFAPWFTAAVYFQYARAALSDRAPLGQAACTAPGAHCSGGTTTRVGAELLFDLVPEGRFRPWLGVGTGYEWMGYDLGDATESGSIAFRGWEWVNVQAGLDLVTGRHAAFGPWAALALGEYTRADVKAPQFGLAADIQRTAAHLWLQLGVRGRFDVLM